MRCQPPLPGTPDPGPESSKVLPQTEDVSVPQGPKGPFPLCFGDRSLPRTVLWGAVCPQPPLSVTPGLSRVSDTCRHTRTAAQPSTEPWSCQLSRG